MTGYLQRLALSAVRTSAIHPVRASIFSPSDDAAAPGPGGADEQIFTTVSAGLSDASRPAAGGVPANVAAVRTASERADEADSPARLQPELLMPRQGDVEISASQAAAQPALAAETARHHDATVRDVSAPPERPFVPLLEVQSREPAALPELPPAPRAPTGLRDGASQYLRPPGERDEIEIHIGRIEVTAVQAAPPPLPRPRRQTPSLDDYLRRRNGGA